MEENKTVIIKIPMTVENLKEDLYFYRELRSFFKEYGKPVEDIDFVINNITSDIESFSDKNIIVPNENEIIDKISKHPYFKNPGDYPIRLLTILKYLKGKGVNMHYADIDLYIDRLLQSMDGVKKVGRGLYVKTR